VEIDPKGRVLMPLKILIADDSRLVTDLAAAMLQSDKIVVIVVPDGKTAIRKLQSVHPDLVLADVKMPDMDGYALCKHIKDDDTLKETPVLLLYSDPEPLDGGKADEVRANGRIKKPFEQLELIPAVARFLPSVFGADLAASRVLEGTKETRNGRVVRLTSDGLGFLEDQVSRIRFAFRFDKISGYKGQVVDKLSVSIGSVVRYITDGQQIISVDPAP